MYLTRYNPDRWFDSMFDRAFGDFFAPSPTLRQAEESTWMPRVDIREHEDMILLEAELPGADKDSVKLEVKDGVLTLSGEKKREETQEKEGVYRSERVYGSFMRQFRLPESVDGEHIEASFRNGVLTVNLPKKPEATARRIEVKSDLGEAKQISAN